MEEHQKKATLPLWTAAKAWWSDSAAQECKNLNWFFILAIFIASTIAISLPFAANRWREADAASQASQYPGLGNVFEDLASKNFEFSISSGKMTVSNSEDPLTLNSGNWDILISTNTDKLHVQEATGIDETKQESEAADIVKSRRNLLQLGPDRFLIRNGNTGILVSAPLQAFEGFSSDILKQAAQNRRTLADLIEGLLFTAAFSSIPSLILTLFLLMLVQNLAFVTILGVMLSFAVYRKKLGDEQEKAIRPLEGIKMAAAIMAGPAFVIGLVGLFIPAFKAPFLWLAYSLLAGIRVVVLYTSRYRRANIKHN
ncbi:hypothetical protein [Gracilinema caldarium]|uniref:hypothetical protein n=1 Tax=Gracilinema caldarium TaxID=215591 RepID=UPI0026E99C6D|nr:hypothetical protein [Gracilinema caldarium]